MEDREMICFQLISNAGVAKTACFNAIRAAKKGEFEEAAKFLEEAKEMFAAAHEIHGQLIKEEASGDKVFMTLFLTHAEDILMSSELSKDMAEEFIDVYKAIKNV